MSENSACPDLNTLKELLLGKLPKPELESLGKHLLQCERCTKSADTIVAEDDLTTAIHARRILKGDEEVLTKVLERSKRLISQAETVIPDAAGTAEDNIDPNATKIGMLGDHGDDEFGFLAPAQESDEIGRLGDYRILQVLGIGGMGVVFRAEDSRLKRQVAIKVMKPTVASSRSAKDRFIREAQFTAAIEHDNIVQIYQVGEDNGVPFIAMPFLKGESLKKRLERKGRLPQADVIKIGIQVAAGLAAAHERNLIHRDIKPDNLWLEEKTGRVKILDFGLVRASSEDAGLTQSGAVMGTPRYMAPEQAMGEAIDSRCDLFSLGSVLYHLISGKLPFEGANLTATLMAVVHQEPKPLDSVAEGLHPELVQLINQLLAKDRNNRPAKAFEVAKSLTVIHQELKRETSKLANGEPRGGGEEMPKLLAQPLWVEPQSGKEEPQPVNATKTTPKPPSGPPKKRILLAAGAGGILLVMLGVLIYTITDKDGNKTVVKAPSGTPVEFDLKPGSKLKVREEAEAATSPVVSNPTPQISDSTAGWPGWPVDAPKPAIAPFDADQAKKHQEEWATYLKVPVEYTNSIGMKFRFIPPGEFLMGSTLEEIESVKMARKSTGEDSPPLWIKAIDAEGPVHRVVLTKGFFLCECETTQHAYMEVMGENPSAHSPAGLFQEKVKGIDTASLPVENVAWDKAAQFCSLLSATEHFTSPYRLAGGSVIDLEGIGYRLPTEAEWEFAARAGTITRYSFGDDESQLPRHAWIIQPNQSTRTRQTGMLLPNAFGLYDVHGNVAEWCQDRTDNEWYRELKSQKGPAINPVAPGDYAGRKVRGGSLYAKLPQGPRSAFRDHYPLQGRADGSIGFRAAISIDAVRQALNLSYGQYRRVGWQGWPADAPKPAIVPFVAEQAKKHQEEWAAYLKVPVEQEVTLRDDVTIDFVLIPPGEFVMGSPSDEFGRSSTETVFMNESQHSEVVSAPLFVARDEVTQAQFQQLMGFNPSQFSDGELPKLPVEQVSWYDAVAFCNSVSDSLGFTSTYAIDIIKKDGESISNATVTLKEAQGLRLLTEAEWEYSCRAGTTTTFSFGSTIDGQKANFNTQPDQNSKVNDYRARTVNSDTFGPNRWGLRNMHGNVWEWCWDEFKQDLPTGMVTLRAMRGGSWNGAATGCRSACRQAPQPSIRTPRGGFRVALSIDAMRKLLDKAGQASSVSSPHPTQGDSPLTAIAPFDAAEAKKHQEEWAEYLNVPIEDTNTIGMHFQLIPPGEFLMGSSDSELKSNIEESDRNNLYGKDTISLEGPQHKVSIRKPFSIGKTEVTRSQFSKFVNTTGYVTESHRNGKGGHGLKEKQWVQAPEFHWDSQRELLQDDPDNHPVVNVSWNDAVAFCEWLSQQEKTVYRLPTEAEWEYCHRAGSTGQFGVVDDPQLINELDWVQSGPATDSWTKPVGLKKPNPFGIYGMYGNVREWCIDRFGVYSSLPIEDPVGSNGEEYVVRGGAYFASRFINRVTYRSHLAGNVSSWATGFRVIREVSSDYAQPEPGNSK